MLKFFRVFLVVICFALPVQAEQVFGSRIVAKVNGGIVTANDVIDRMLLIVASNNVEDSFEFRQKALPLVMKQLIDERIQLNVAEEAGIEVDDREILKAKMRMIGSSEVTPDQVDAYFVRKGVPLQTLEDQIRAGISWGKYVGSQYRRADFREDDDAQNMIDRLTKEAGEQQQHLYEIFSENKEDLENAAQQLNKENFARAAQQISKSSSAPRGGEIGWVSLEDLNKEMREATKNLGDKKVSNIIKTDEGYHLLFVQGIRTVAVPEDEDFEEWRASLEENLRKKNLTILSKYLMNKHRRDVHLEVKL